MRTGTVPTWGCAAVAMALAACSSSPGAGGGGASSHGASTATSSGSGGAGGSTPSDAGADAPSGVTYDQDGPVAYMQSVAQVTSGGSSLNVTVLMPTTPGPHPVVSFSCGLSQSAAGYLPYGKRLASYGIATLITDDPGILTNTGDIVPNAVYVVETWLPATFSGQVDMAKIGLGGHSRGGAVSLLAAELGLAGKVVAWFGLDPVDNEFLMAPKEYARTDLPQIGIPTAYLGASVVSNCAPATDDYQVLYPLSPSPSVLLVGQGAGHVDFESAAGCTGCGICTPAGTADPDVVLAYAVRYFTAFFARELLGDASVGPAFEGAGAPGDVAAGLVTVTSK
jgi:hypothetical protein